MSTKNFFVTLLFSVLAFFAVGAMQAQAAPTDNVFGEAWSDDIGWISFNNCTNPTTCSGTDYGVKMNTTNGNLSGGAWSDNIGWISFSEISGCPIPGCTTQPRVNLATGDFTGFARALSYGGGWDGWIALNATDVGQTGWGWKEDISTGAVTGQAWGDLVNGWIVPFSTMRIDNGGLSYTITSCSGPNGTVTPSVPVSVPYGGSQTYTITPNSGYKIASLTVDGAPVAIVGSYTFSSVQADHAICATFAPIAAVTHTITACSPTNGSITPPPLVATVNDGDSRTYTITPDPGFDITSLVVNGSTKPAASSWSFTNVTSDQTICATFTPAATYTIDASAGAGGSVNPSGLKTYNLGDSKTYTITPSPGFSTATLTIDGIPNGVVPAYAFKNISADHTISATFIAIPPANGPHTIVASSGPNGTVTPINSTSVPYGGSQLYLITPDSASGYSIATLIIDGSPVTIVPGYVFQNVTANHTIYASFYKAPPGPTAPECNDLIDNDGDGLNNFPDDPGCSSLLDNTEKNKSIIYIER